jgi:hypothetical protein
MACGIADCLVGDLDGLLLCRRRHLCFWNAREALDAKVAVTEKRRSADSEKEKM